ncbi:MAG: transposase [Ekhidna sp.]|nr:transposase [Ekhidna sp.]
MSSLFSQHGSLGYEYQNTNWSLSLGDAQWKIGSWQKKYNEFRQHSSLRLSDT